MTGSANNKNSSVSRREVLQLAALAGIPATSISEVKAGRPRQSNNSTAAEEIIMGLPESVDDLSEAAKNRSPSGSTVVRTNATLNFAVIRPPTRAQASATVNNLNRRDDVRYAEQNGTLSIPSQLTEDTARTDATATTDTTAGSDSLGTNDPRYDTQYAPQQVNADDTWATKTGSSDVTIAVVDTGTKYDHEDLAANVNDSASNHGYDFVDKDSDPYPEDFSASFKAEDHGTHVSGIAGSATNNSTGVAGISDCGLLFVRVLGTDGSGLFSDVAEGIQWATDNGADIINLSLGSKGVQSSAVGDALVYADKNDVVIIAAAGNDGQEVTTYEPASRPECIAVSAVNDSENLCSFSNYGDYVDIAAPGKGVYSTYPADYSNGGPADRYVGFSGTSMATPIVAGVAGLIRSVNPDLSKSEVEQILADTASNIGLTTKEQGAGQVDAKAAVDAANPVDRAIVDRTASESATFSGGGRDYTVNAAGSDIWDGEDEYGAVYEESVSGDVVAKTTVTSQEATDSFARSGLIISNDLPDTSTAGDVVVNVTPNGYAQMLWDSDGDGALDTHQSEKKISSLPVQLRLRKTGDSFTGEYSTDGGSTWRKLATTTLSEATTTQDVGLIVTSRNPGTNCTTKFADFSSTATDLFMLDTTNVGNATSSGSAGNYTVSAAGSDIWDGEDEYGAVYEQDVSGDIVTKTTVMSQEATDSFARSGLIVSNDLTDTSASGDVVVNVTPNGYAQMLWDSDGDGALDTHQSEKKISSLPVQLRLRKTGDSFTGEYSTDGGSTWTELATTTLSTVTNTQDVGLVVTSRNQGTKCTTKFADFSVTETDVDLSTVDTTGAGNATFSGSNGDYTIDAAGSDIWAGEDEYGAVYEESVSGDVVAEATITSQEATDSFARSGLVISNDLSNTSTAGDVVVNVTPNGYAQMLWDGDGDGALDTHQSEKKINSLPSKLRISKNNGTLTGEYSTDGGLTWTELETVSVPMVASTQDVGLFVTSRNQGTKCTTKFVDFAMSN